MLVPLRSDGLCRHPPHATAAIVLLNFAVALLIGCVSPFLSFLKPSDPELLFGLVLHYNGFEPWTWITSAFVHGGVAHLCGNMMFLVAFGMAVEGVLGWRRFALYYVAIAFVSGAAEWLLFHGGGGGSYGASGCIFGLIATAALWVPRNRVTVFYWVWRWVGTRELSVLALGGWWIGWELFLSWRFDFILFTPMLHLVGAVAGAGAALAFLRLGWVDCEGEDVFSLAAEARARRLKEAPLPEHLPEPQPFAPYGFGEALGSFLAFCLPVAAGGLIAAGLVLGATTPWEEDWAAARAFLAFSMAIAGAVLFRYWQNR